MNFLLHGDHVFAAEDCEGGCTLSYGFIDSTLFWVLPCAACTRAHTCTQW